MKKIFGIVIGQIYWPRGAEAEDYEAPGSNPGQELSNMKMYFSIRKAISNSLYGAARSGTSPHRFIRCERHMLVP
jgi:hypothetical protein